MRPRVAVEQRNVPLNVCAKFGVVAPFRTPKRAINHLKIKRRMLGHPAENRGHVLNGMGGDGQDSVTAFSHGRPLPFLEVAVQNCGSLSSARRCPESEYNSFRGTRGCAKLPEFRWKCSREAVAKGLRFTVSFRTGAGVL